MAEAEWVVARGLGDTVPVAAPLNVLFVCSRNKWRSPTAAKVFGRDPALRVRAAGLSDVSPRRLTANDLQWADLVLVMEPHHRQRIRATFQPKARTNVSLPPIEVLDIPDDYTFMDAALVELLRAAVPPLVARWLAR